MKEFRLKLDLADFRKAYIEKSYFQEFLKYKNRIVNIVILLFCLFTSMAIYTFNLSKLVPFLVLLIFVFIYVLYLFVKDIIFYFKWMNSIEVAGAKNEKYTNPRIVIDDSSFYFKSEEEISKNSFDSFIKMDLSTDKVFLVFEKENYLFTRNSFVNFDFDEFVLQMKELI